jgi:hypothetical protein
MSGWHSLANFSSRQYRCGHCGFSVASNIGYMHNDSLIKLHICPNCDKPTFFSRGSGPVPGVVPGEDVQHLPTDVAALYREARSCCAVSAYTASVLASRKLLMNIAVQQGAKEGDKFVQYVDHLADKGYIPPNGRAWVDHIRKKGNEATHEIALMRQDDAEELIAFAEMLLKFIFEFPARVPTAP